MKKFLVLIALLLWSVMTFAQEVKFFSKEFEIGVKLHLGLGEDDVVNQQHVDTITRINLSGLGILDIRDILWLPSVQTLDLSDNFISDVSALAMLDSLQLLNVSNNDIEDICPLIFSHADSMEVILTGNNIEDYSCFFRPTHCLFTLTGISSQTSKNAPYFSVYQFYVAYDDKGKQEAVYHAYTNTDAPSYMICGSSRSDAVIDGQIHSTPLPQGLTSTLPVKLTHGEFSDSTYIVPSQHYLLSENGTTSIETGLPDNYVIGFASALHGEVSIDGSKLHYKSQKTEITDTLYLSYHQGGQLRGLSLLFVGKTPTAINTESLNPVMQMSLKNHRLLVKCHLPELIETSTISVFNTAGRLLAKEQVDSSNGIDAELFVRHARHEVLIVQVVSGHKRFIEKLIAE